MPGCPSPVCGPGTICRLRCVRKKINQVAAVFGNLVVSCRAVRLDLNRCWRDASQRFTWKWARYENFGCCRTLLCLQRKEARRPLNSRKASQPIFVILIAPAQHPSSRCYDIHVLNSVFLFLAEPNHAAAQPTGRIRKRTGCDVAREKRRPRRFAPAVEAKRRLHPATESASV